MTAARTRTRRSALVAIAVAGLLGTTACGTGAADAGAGGDVASLDDGSSPDAPASTTDDTTSPQDMEDATLAFTECMRDHGVDMPDPQISPDGGAAAIAIEGDLDDATFQDAQTACEPLMENARGEIDIDPEQQAEMQADLLAFAECMREHGIDMADPVFSADGRVTQQGLPPGGDDAELGGDDFEAAADECGRGEEGGPMIAVSPSGGDSGRRGADFSVGAEDEEDD